MSIHEERRLNSWKSLCIQFGDLEKEKQLLKKYDLDTNSVQKVLSYYDTCLLIRNFEETEQEQEQEKEEEQEVHKSPVNVFAAMLNSTMLQKKKKPQLIKKKKNTILMN